MSQGSATTTTADEAALRRLIDEALAEREQGAHDKENKITIVAWDGHLDRVWPTLILSTTAAASGMQVSVFFTFWGLFALVKPEKRRTGKKWMTKALSVMNPAALKRAKLSRYNFAGLGPWMLSKVAGGRSSPATTSRVWDRGCSRRSRATTRRRTRRSCWRRPVIWASGCCRAR